jgi:hypothetical protein
MWVESALAPGKEPATSEAIAEADAKKIRASANVIQGELETP